MRVAWKYIDKTKAAIAAIQDYDNQRAIINTTPEEVKAVFDKMAAPMSARLTGMPGSRNPQAFEKKMVDGMDRMDLLHERYGWAAEYMAWFGPAWETLTDTERIIIREFYMTGSQRSGAAARLQSMLSYSDRQVDRLRGKAMSRLTVLLYGR